MTKYAGRERDYLKEYRGKNKERMMAQRRIPEVAEKRRAWRREWNAKNRERIREINRRPEMKAKARDRHRRSKSGIEGVFTHLLYMAKGRCKKYGLEFNLYEFKDVLFGRFLAGSCELSGVPFNLDRHPQPHPESPTIDRIDPKRGYVFGNVRFICWALNRALGADGEDNIERVFVSWLRSRGYRITRGGS